MFFIFLKLAQCKSCSQLVKVVFVKSGTVIIRKGSSRKRRVSVVFKSPGSLNGPALWLKSLPRSVTWAFPFCSPIISWARGAQPNPSSSKRRGQQSARCDHQLITHYPSNQDQSPHRCEASLVLNTHAGRLATEAECGIFSFLSSFFFLCCRCHTLDKFSSFHPIVLLK